MPRDEFYHDYDTVNYTRYIDRAGRVVYIPNDYRLGQPRVDLIVNTLKTEFVASHMPHELLLRIIEQQDQQIRLLQALVKKPRARPRKKAK